MTAKAQSEGIPQDTAPSRYSLVSIARNVSIFLFLCGMIAVQVQPTQNLSGERAHQTAVVNEDLLNTVQLKAPLVNAVKGIRAHRRLLSEDQEELDDSEYPSKSTRRLKGKGGRGRNGGRSKGRSGRSKGKKGRSKGSKGSKGSGRFSRSQTFSPFPTETPFPTSTPFPTVTPFPTITPYPTGVLLLCIRLFNPYSKSM